MATITATQKAGTKRPQRHPLFVQVCEELDLEAPHFDKVKLLSAESFLTELFTCIEHKPKAKKQSDSAATSLIQRLHDYYSTKTKNEQLIMNQLMVFIKNFEHFASIGNEFRFYANLLNEASADKHVSEFLQIRKSVLQQKGIRNYAGLSMDKTNLSFDEWSGVINKAFAAYTSIAQVVQKFQANLERLTKENMHLKQSKETVSRVTMTTFVESMMEVTRSLEKHFDQRGRHLVEDNAHPTKTMSSATKQHPTPSPRVGNTPKSQIESPLKLLNRFVQEQQGSISNKLESKYRSDNSAGQKSSPVVQKVEEDEYLEKIRDKKKSLANELRETEEEKQKQSQKVISSLAELNVLNKELRSLNHHYFEVNKKFEALFRRYMQKYGRTKVSSSDQNTFAQLVKDRKQVDYSAQVNSSLGNPFIRFMRLNFSAIKSEEVNFYTELKNLKDKAAKSSNLGFTKTIDFRSEDDDENLSGENNSQNASDKLSRSDDAPHSKPMPESDHIPVKDSSEKQKVRSSEARTETKRVEGLPNAKGKNLKIETKTSDKPEPERRSQSVLNPRPPASLGQPGPEAETEPVEALVEKIRIERTKSSDEED